MAGADPLPTRGVDARVCVPGVSPAGRGAARPWRRGRPRIPGGKAVPPGIRPRGMTRFTLMPLLTFDQFEAAVPPLLEERPPPPALTCLCPGGSATRGDGAQRAGQSARPRRLRAGQDRSLGRQPGHAVSALARIAPWVDSPLEPARTTSRPTASRRAAATCAPRPSPRSRNCSRCSPPCARRCIYRGSWPEKAELRSESFDFIESSTTASAGTRRSGCSPRSTTKKALSWAIRTRRRFAA